MSDQAEPIGAEGVAIEAAARYVLENSRRGNASLNSEQFAADTSALMKAYRDIIGKAIASGHLAATRTPDPKAAGVEREAVMQIVRATGGKCWDDPGAVEAMFIAYRAGAKSALRAVDAAPGGGVPAGWKLVPVEPTEVMIRAGEKAGWDDHNSMPEINGMTASWSAMLSAAPATATAAPAPNVQALVEALNKALEFACLTLAFIGRDEGTNRLKSTLDGLCEKAKELEPLTRAALAAIQAPAGEGVAPPKDPRDD